MSEKQEIFLRVWVTVEGGEDGMMYAHTVRVPESQTPESTILGVQYAIVDAINTLYAYDNILSYSVESITEEQLAQEVKDAAEADKEE